MDIALGHDGKAISDMPPPPRPAASPDPGPPGDNGSGQGDRRQLPLAVAGAAGLLRGPADLLDFLLPLWVGAQWGLPATVVGGLVAVEAAASLIGRPLAGMLVDRGRPTWVAATGSALYAVSFAVYALAGHPIGLFAAAVIGGAGGSLAWVALRALTGASSTDRGGTFSELVAAEGTGTWIAFVAGLTLLPQIDYRGVFGMCAVACATGAGLLVLRPPRVTDSTRSASTADRRPESGAPAAGYAAVARRMRLFLVVIAITAAAETGVGLLMLLHLQRGFGLDVGAIAAAFLPGFILYSLAPPYLNRIVRRRGRTPVLVVALGCSAAFALGLALAPNPWVISALWILAAVSWAAAAPIEQAVVADTAPFALGRALALYETATLVGILVGGGAAGLLYDRAGGWWLGCVAAAAVLVTAAALAPTALARTGQAGAGRDDAGRDDDPPAPAPPDSAEGRPVAEDPERSSKPRRFDPSNWLFHLGVWTIAQIGLAVAGYSWPVEAIFGGPHDADWWWNDSGHWILNADRIWTAILLLDTIYSGTRWLLDIRRRRRADRRAAVSADPHSDHSE